ncbi:MAG: hypothetical protein JWO38_3415 [Gemmataceae bacterium]|nr:hypothetical protein [Gemmataceae bacterium]
MNRTALTSLFALLIALCVPGPTRAADDKEVQKNKDLIKKVADKLLAVAAAPAGIEWPPEVGLTNEPKINAYASVVRKDGKIYPLVRIYDGMMTKVIKGDEDRLALVLGHEIGHILKRHVLAARGKTPLLEYTFSREEEEEADAAGLELMVKAGYSFAKGVKMITEMQDLGLDYSSFEGLDATHPSWNDRAKRLDKEKAHLWKAMSAFNNGVVFLATEQYSTAELCFDRVTKEFPGCYEAWANLGFACLMQYCDKLDEKDLRDYGIGQIITGGFYHRAQSIKVRMRDAKLWFKAVGALRQSNQIKPDQTLVLANLGLAYLVHPDGKDVGEATRFLTEAAEAAKADKALDPVAHAGLLINLGVATLADGKVEKGLTQLDEGERLIRKVGGSVAVRRAVPTLDAALLYTRALALTTTKDKADREKAVGMFEKYLKTCSPLSLWWPVAYERYEAVCQETGRAAKPRDAFKKDRPEPVRLVVGVKLKSGAEVTLSEDVEDVEKKLGKGKETVVVPASTLKRIRYEKEGVELLAGDEVLAITLVGPDAPGVALQGKTVGAGQAGTLKVGMTTKEVEHLLGDDYQPCEITTAGVFYRFYREQGVALRVVKGQVVEVVVVQIPSPKQKY